MAEKQPVTILLVEDDHYMLSGIKELLEMANTGYDVTVLTASDGAEGLAKLEEQTPDLIISDIMMPHMTGYQFLNEVKKKAEWMQVPFIFLTAKGEKGDYDQGKLQGASLYITKPFDSIKFLELIVTQLDKSLKRQAFQQQHVDSLKKNILQILNHEFRTPLTYVTAYYEMLDDSINQMAGNRNYQEYLRGIQAGCLRLTKLVEDFILVMELRSGGAQAIYHNTASPIPDLNDLLQEAVNNCRTQARQYQVALHLNVAEELPVIFGVRENVRSIIERLLDNAIKFTKGSHNKEPGNVYISAETKGDKVRLSIQDEGSGIPDHMHGNLFDLFFQYNRAALEQQGAGAGLTIAKGLIDLHQGDIEIESREGGGSKFTIVFPQYSGQVHEAFAPPSMPPRQKVTILAVEDDLNLLDGLADLLQTLDYKYELAVMTAVNGQEALQQMKKQKPDLIISDIMMPKMSGYEFLQEVRQNPAWLHIPFIFLTARGEPADKHEGFRRGVDEYITKPYDSDVLLQFVEAQLNRHFQIQGILSQSFDALKQGILNLITPDFRQPLSAVRDHTEKLAAELQSARTDEELTTSLRGIRSGSVRLTRLVEDFIYLAELKTGEALAAYQLQANPITNISALLAEFELIYVPKLANEAITIHVDPVDEHLPAVYGDAAKLQEMLRRLIMVGSNYCQDENGLEVTLSASSNQEQVHFKLAFSGLMPRETADKCTRILAAEEDDEVLALLDVAPDLRIVKGYAALHNGHIIFDQNVAGECLFIIVLPIYQLSPHVEPA